MTDFKKAAIEHLGVKSLLFQGENTKSELQIMTILCVLQITIILFVVLAKNKDKKKKHYQR